MALESSDCFGVSKFGVPILRFRLKSGGFYMYGVWDPIIFRNRVLSGFYDFKRHK